MKISIIKKIRAQVSNGLLMESLNMFYENIRDEDKGYMNEIIALTGRLSTLEKNERIGDIYISEARHERNIITHSFLKILQELSNLDPEEPTFLAKNRNELAISPNPKPYFTGRKKEIQLLQKSIVDDSVVLVDGIGGIGKTQIVSKVIENRKQKGDNIIWYNCNENSELDTLITLSGYGEILIDDKSYSDKIFNFIKILKENKHIIVLDNYHNIYKNEIFRDFIKTCLEFLSSSIVIVVSRINIISESIVVKRIHVKGFEKERYSFAEAIIQYSFSEEFRNFNISYKELTKVCDSLSGHPLGIELALLLISNGEKPDHIVEKLVKHGKGDINNKVLLDRLLNQKSFSEEEIEFMKLVSVFRGNTNKDILEALLPKYVYDCLQRLIKKNILSNNDKFIECHPLVNEFFYSKLEKKEEMHLRVAKFLEKANISLLERGSFEEPLIYHLVKAGEWDSVNKILAEKELESLIRRNQQVLLLDKTKEISRLNAELKNINGEIRHISYTISHDLREPIRSMRSYAQLIQKRFGEQLDSNAGEFLNFIADDALRMDRMLQGLLNYLVVGKDELVLDNVDLNEIITAVCSSLNLQIEATNASIRFKDLPFVFGEYSLLLSLFQNLISNSIKFCKERAPIVIIEHTEYVNTVLITVKDNGIGIPDEYKDMIFAVFRRLQTSDEFEGSGVGLSICKKIVKTLNGKIWVESDMGIGSKFYIEIPKKTNKPATI